ncbi:hypothetical protein V1477_005096 [Vespula maculifrons]|uniref:Uncharacterized protein n=1 Tax=Vespula maculifrons TaxID=7453 RepID=A0ABD2CNP2_VESMC
MRIVNRCCKVEFIESIPESRLAYSRGAKLTVPGNYFVRIASMILSPVFTLKERASGCAASLWTNRFIVVSTYGNKDWRWPAGTNRVGSDDKWHALPNRMLLAGVARRLLWRVHGDEGGISKRAFDGRGNGNDDTFLRFGDRTIVKINRKFDVTPRWLNTRREIAFASVQQIHIISYALCGWTR